MLEGIYSLTLTDEVEEVARLLVEKKVMPGPISTGDAVHVALAIVHRIQYILTWNIKHLANPNKRVHLAVFCMQLNLPCPQLVTPDMLKWSASNE